MSLFTKTVSKEEISTILDRAEQTIFELSQTEEIKYKLYKYLNAFRDNIDTVTNQGTYVSENSRLLFVKIG